MHTEYTILTSRKCILCSRTKFANVFNELSNQENSKHKAVTCDIVLSLIYIPFITPAPPCHHLIFKAVFLLMFDDAAYHQITFAVLADRELFLPLACFSSSSSLSDAVTEYCQDEISNIFINIQHLKAWYLICKCFRGLSVMEWKSSLKISANMHVGLEGANGPKCK